MKRSAFTAKKTAKCRYCKHQFVKKTMAHVCCGAPECRVALAIQAEEKNRMKAEREQRADIKQRRDKLKTLTDWIADVQVVFNRYIRERDRDLPCICCGKFNIGWSRGGIFDAGHYRSRGSAGHLRFDERNVHKQLKQCNSYGAGRNVDFRVGLIGRIGLEAVEALEADNAAHKWTIEELKELKALYSKKFLDLKKGNYIFNSLCKINQKTLAIAPNGSILNSSAQRQPRLGFRGWRRK